MRDGVIPSRHVLYGEDDNEDELLQVKHTLQVDSRVPKGATILLVAWRLGSLATEAGIAGSPLIVLTTATSYQMEPTSDLANSNLYEVPPEDDGEVASAVSRVLMVYVKSPQFVIIVVPALDESESAYAGKHLIEELKPKKLLVASPGQSFDPRPVSRIYTTAAAGDLTSQQRSELATPPVIVQGAAATAISAAERHGIAAEALIVRSDGPVGHEIITTDDFNMLRERVFASAGMNIISNHDIRSNLSTLYV